MERIYKYPLEWKAEQTIELPLVGALTVQMQNHTPCLWAVVNEEVPTVKIKVYMVGTGQEIDCVEKELAYLNTVQYGVYVWHFFIEGNTNV